MGGGGAIKDLAKAISMEERLDSAERRIARLEKLVEERRK